MGRPFPTATYFIPFVAPAIRALAWVWQDLLRLQPWWPHLPWAAILAASASFLAGLLLQDLYNPASWLTRLWGRWNHSLEITRLVLTGDATAGVKLDAFAAPGLGDSLRFGEKHLNGAALVHADQCIHLAAFCDA